MLRNETELRVDSLEHPGHLKTIQLNSQSLRGILPFWLYHAEEFPRAHEAVHQQKATLGNLW